MHIFSPLFILSYSCPDCPRKTKPSSDREGVMDGSSKAHPHLYSEVPCVDIFCSYYNYTVNLLHEIFSSMKSFKVRHSLPPVWFLTGQMSLTSCSFIYCRPFFVQVHLGITSDILGLITSHLLPAWKGGKSLPTVLAELCSQFSFIRSFSDDAWNRL